MPEINYDFGSSKPATIGFDFDSAIEETTPQKQKVFIESTGDVAEMQEGTLDIIYRIASGAYEKGTKSLELNHLYQRQLFGEEPTQAMKDRIVTLRGELQKEIKTNGYHQEMLRALFEQTPQLLEMGAKVAERSLQGALIFGGGAFALGQAGPQAALPEEIITVPAAMLDESAETG